MSVHKAGEAEIDGGLNPEDTQFGKDLTDRGTHRVDSDEGPDTKGAGEYPGHTLPSTRDAGLRPRDASQEK